jgi:hypothetical protein
MPPKPTTLRGVAVGHEALLADGSWVRVAATLAGQPFVRRADEGARQGPRPMPGHTPVFDTRAPAADAAARDTTPVADPVGGAPAGDAAGPTLFNPEGTP